MGQTHRLPVAVSLVELGKCRIPVPVDGTALRLAERADDVPLTESATGTGREHEIARSCVGRRELVTSEDRRQLLRDRDCSRGPVRLRRLAVPVAVDLPAELYLGVVWIFEPDICPCQRK